MTRALESRLDRFERRIRKANSSPAAIEGWINQCLDDPTFLEEEIRVHPGRPGSHLAEVNAALLAAIPFIRSGGMMPPPRRGEA